MVKHISKIAYGSDVYYMKDTEARSALIDKTEKGVANGVATLDSGGKVPSSQLPSYVDDVEEYSSLSNFPATGENGKIYVDTTTNLSYRWSGSTYVTISSDLALGETSSTAYAGDKGKAVTDNFNAHADNTDIHVTAAEKEYWNNKVNPPSYSVPTAKLLTYTGEPQALLNAGSSTAGTIQYSIDQNEWSTNIPQATNAGTYYAYWRFIGSESIYVEPTAIEVIIEKANPAYTAPVANTLVYNGGSQELITEGSSNDGVFSYSPDGEEWNSAIPQGTDATEYTVYWKLTGDANHVDINATPVTIHISKVTPTVSAPVSKTGLIYNATAQDLINAGSTNFGVLQYSLDNVNYGTSIPQGINAVEYNIYYKVIGNSNINDISSASITSSIAKVTPTVTAPTPKTLTFNGQAQELINAGSADFGTIQYKVGTDSWSTSIPTRTKGGSYTLSYKVVGDSNINDVLSESITCSISEKEITATVELSQTSYVYDGSAKTPSVTVKDGDVVVDPSEYSVSYSNNTNAGTSTVSVYDNEGGDYDVIGSTTFIITKASGSVITVPTAKSLTYSGSAQTLANAGSGTGTMYYSLDETSNFSTTIPTGTNAGSYTVYYYSAESNNYNQSATGNILVTISKANGSVTEAPTAKSLTYNGEAQTLANAGSGTGTMYYSLNSSSDFSTTIPTGTNATSYTVYYYAAESSNYKQSTIGNISVSIAKADASYTAPTAKSLTYNGSDQALLNAGSVTGGTIQYSADNNTWSTTIPSQTNAGTYISYWRILGDSNHNDKASASISTTIAKASQSAPTATGATTTYNTTATATASGGGGQGSLEWSNGNTQTSVGSKNTQARWTGNSNYNASAWSNSVTITMNKATGSVTTVPTAKSLTYNGNAQALINAGSGTGTMYYSLSSSSGFSTTIPTGTNGGTYTVYYYAAESTNYNKSATSNMQVSIGKANRTVTVSGNQTSMTPGQSNTITVTATGNPASSLISVTSSNTAVATISGTTVNAVGGGTTTITAIVASDTNYNSGSASYSLNVAWPNGIYAAYADGSMRTAENADTNAIGVAVITDNCKFIIDKTNDARKAWDSKYSTNKIIEGCFVTNGVSVAKTDYSGVSNTNAIAAVVSGGEAAKYCRSCSKTIAGKTVYGYLGACGEWQTAYDNKSTVDSIMSTIGGTDIQISNSYWSSTQYQNGSTNHGYHFNWKNALAGTNNKNTSSYWIRPFYEIS